MNAPFPASRRQLPVLCLGLLLLSACGGGGGSDDAPAQAADTGLAAVLGTYAVPCEGSTSTTGSMSSQGKLSINASSNASAPTLDIHYQAYASAPGDTAGSRCESAALVWDLILSGHIRDMDKRKAIRLADNSTVSAKVVEFTYTGLRLSKGSFSGQFPTPNTTTQVAYLLDNGNLRLTSGPREADGVAAKFHRRVGVRQ